MNNNDFVLRYAPSPTGDIHFGNTRTALFGWATARKNNGKFILRIEDTDKERSTKESEDLILKDLKWLGLDWDEFYRQSERTEIYKKSLDYLIENNFVYACNCDKGKDCACDGQNLEFKPEYAIRFRVPNEGYCVFNDIIAGQVSVPWKEIEDFAVCRGNRLYTFYLCVTVDDLEMGITHIVRGKDHLSNMPKQMILSQAFGKQAPLSAHLPLVKGETGAKLSKRDGSSSIVMAREKGILSEAVLSTLVRLGWSHGNQEIFTKKEIIELFDLQKVQKSPAIFDYKKLLHASGKFLSQMDDNTLLDRFLEWAQEYFSDYYQLMIQNLDTLKKAIPYLKNRSKTLKDLLDLGDFIYKAPASYKINDIVLNNAITDYKNCLPHCFESIESYKELSDQMLLKHLVSFKDFSSALREILTGKPISPGVFEIIYIIGVPETISRINNSLGL